MSLRSEYDEEIDDPGTDRQVDDDMFNAIVASLIDYTGKNDNTGPNTVQEE